MLCVDIGLAITEGELEDEDDQLQSEREESHDVAQPLLCSQCRRKRVDDWRNEDGENEQNQTNDNCDAKDSVHSPGV